MPVPVIACLETDRHKVGLRGQEFSVYLCCDCFISGRIKDENSGLDSQLE